MDYFEWAEEYYANARSVMTTLQRLKSALNDSTLTADRRKSLNDQITEYRRIYHEQRRIGDLLLDRAQRYADEA